MSCSNVQLIKNAFYCEMNGKYNITLLFFGSNFVTKALPINSIDSKCHTEKLKGSLIGFHTSFHVNNFNSPEADTHTHGYQLPGQKQFQETRRTPGLKRVM